MYAAALLALAVVCMASAARAQESGPVNDGGAPNDVGALEHGAHTRGPHDRRTPELPPALCPGGEQLHHRHVGIAIDDQSR